MKPKEPVTQAIRILRAAQIPDKTPDGKLHFPYDGLHLELNWRVAT